MAWAERRALRPVRRARREQDNQNLLVFQYDMRLSIIPIYSKLAEKCVQ
jgi:hypothetical protein